MDWRADGVAARLPSKCEALSSNPSATKTIHSFETFLLARIMWAINHLVSPRNSPYDINFTGIILAPPWTDVQTASPLLSPALHPSLQRGKKAVILGGRPR
jgi:hypothetical protein